MDDETTIQMRAPASLVSSFDSIARSEDLTRSQLVRRLMRDYVQRNGQADWVEQSRPAAKKKAASKKKAAKKRGAKR